MIKWHLWHFPCDEYFILDAITGSTGFSLVHSTGSFKFFLTSSSLSDWSKIPWDDDHRYWCCLFMAGIEWNLSRLLNVELICQMDCEEIQKVCMEDSNGWIGQGLSGRNQIVITFILLRGSICWAVWRHSDH